jgi:hypothetical protein
MNKVGVGMNPLVLNFGVQKLLADIYDAIDIQEAFEKYVVTVVVECEEEVVNKAYFELMKHKWVKEVNIIFSHEMQAYHITVVTKPRSFARQLIEALTK